MNIAIETENSSTDTSMSMFGFLKNLLHRSREVPAEDFQPQRASVAASAGESRRPFAMANQVPRWRQNLIQQDGNGHGTGIEISLQKILNGLPLELQPRVRQPDVGDLAVSIPLEKVLAQLSRGVVKISFGELRAAFPDVFSFENDRDRTLVPLPLEDVLASLNPAIISRRRAQRHVEVPDEIVSPFDQQGQGPAFDLGAIRGGTESTPEFMPARQTSPVTPVPLSPPRHAATPPPPLNSTLASRPAPSSAPLPPPPAPASVPTASHETALLRKSPTEPAISVGPVPLSFRQPPAPAPAPPVAMPPTVQMPAAAPATTSAATPAPPRAKDTAFLRKPPLEPATGASPLSLRLSPVQAPTPAAPVPPVHHVVPPPGGVAAPALSAPAMSAATRALREAGGQRASLTPVSSPAPATKQEDSQPLMVNLSALAEAWPDAVRREIVEMNLVEAVVALPVGAVERALKQGRIVFSWKALRSWIQPAVLPSLSAHDNAELELPLKIVAPLFLARQAPPDKGQAKVAVDEDIPNLFFGLPQGEHAAKSAAVKPADTNYYIWNDGSEQIRGDESDLARSPSPGTRFITRYATPNEIVSRAGVLDGVAGALIALPDGLMVASKLSPDVNGDTLAAFLPQIFVKVSQCTKELRMGELNNLSFTVGNVPWKIFRVNAIFFAAFGFVGRSLPTAALAALAAELDHKPK